MLTQNISAPLGLVNVTTDVVQDFVLVADGEAPSLLELVWVDCGHQYKNTTFFVDNTERKCWISIYPLTNQHITSMKKTFFRSERIATAPLLDLKRMEGSRSDYSWLPYWQALDAEQRHGLAYTEFFRAIRLLDIGIIGGLA